MPSTVPRIYAEVLLVWRHASLSSVRCEPLPQVVCVRVRSGGRVIAQQSRLLLQQQNLWIPCPYSLASCQTTAQAAAVASVVEAGLAAAAAAVSEAAAGAGTEAGAAMVEAEEAATRPRPTPRRRRPRPPRRPWAMARAAPRHMASTGDLRES